MLLYMPNISLLLFPPGERNATTTAMSKIRIHIPESLRSSIQITSRCCLRCGYSVSAKWLLAIIDQVVDIGIPYNIPISTSTGGFNGPEIKYMKLYVIK